jgi:hypothetical protein
MRELHARTLARIADTALPQPWRKSRDLECAAGMPFSY